MDRQRFGLPVATTLRIESRSGKIHVIAEPRDDAAVEGDRATGDAIGDATLLVRSGYAGSKSMTVWCPVGTDVVVGTQSGSVRMEGEFGCVSVTTISGSIELDTADAADLRSISGSITLGACAGRCRMSSKSGKLSCVDAGAALVGTVSGSIKLEHVSGDVRARSVSGTVDIAADGDGEIAIETVSGKVRIALPEGTEPDVHAKSFGGVRSELAAGADCLVRARSLSGQIDVVAS